MKIGEKDTSEYKVYLLIKDYKGLETGSFIFESIDYNVGFKTHYFDDLPGEGGNPLFTIQEVENNPDIFAEFGSLDDYFKFKGIYGTSNGG